MTVDFRDDGEGQTQQNDLASAGAPADDDALEELRRILFDPYRAQLNDLADQLHDDEMLAAIISPIMGEAIRRKIREGRDEMIEALYPILGQLVTRSVAEAVRDLARTVDARMRTSYTPQALLRRLRVRLSGGSMEELALREALPFQVAEVFLIHRETGLLLWHQSSDPSAKSDSDLVSGMLTAIRDFVADAFGRNQEGQLDEIQYGDRRILIEAAQLVYLAVVVDGIEPSGFRGRMRAAVMEVSHAYQSQLRSFAGDVGALEPAGALLSGLVEKPQTVSASEPVRLSRTQKRFLGGALAIISMCSLLACLAGTWTWRVARTLSITPTPVVLVIVATPTTIPTATATPTPTTTATPTATASATPTASPTATATPTPSPTPTATATPLPPQAVVSVLRLLVRSGPGQQYAPIAVVQSGQAFDVIGRSADDRWWQVCCLADGARGWVSQSRVVVAGPANNVPAVPVVAPTP